MIKLKLKANFEQNSDPFVVKLCAHDRNLLADTSKEDIGIYKDEINFLSVDSERGKFQIFIEDKSFLHKNHKGNDKDKFHLKITVKSKKLKFFSKVEANKIIYKSISDELKTHIHSIQLSINQ